MGSLGGPLYSQEQLGQHKLNSVGKEKKKKEKSSKLGGKGWLLRGADGVNMFKMDYNEILGELIKIVF